MVLGTVLLLGAILSGQGAQQPQIVGAPTAVDVRVARVDWHPKSLAVMYRIDSEDTMQIGLFKDGMVEGARMLRVPKADRLEMQWLEGVPVLVVKQYRDLENSEGSITEASVIVLDVRATEPKVVFRQRYPAKDQVSIDFEPSPSLKHAIFRVATREGIRHLILTPSAGPLIACGALDDAVQQGASGPTWTVNGTAVYALQAAKSSTATLEVGGESLLTSGGTIQLELAIVGGSLKTRLSARPPAPEMGTPVWELMPSNGVLRPVRFAGEWSSAEVERQVDTKPHAVEIRFQGSVGAAKSLWLIRRAGEGIPVLIAPHADGAWLSPDGGSVAYTVDGALFHRQLQGR